MANLQLMFDMQEKLQAEAYGRSPGELVDEDRALFIKDMVLASLDELHEALNEVGWKPWATSRHVHEDALKGELVDLFHFFMNLCLAAGMDASDLQTRYLKKRQKNITRQQHGYNGVDEKCKDCGRAMDDDAVLCTPLLCWEGK